MIFWPLSLRIKDLRGTESGHDVFYHSRFGLTSDDCIGENQYIESYYTQFQLKIET